MTPLRVWSASYGLEVKGAIQMWKTRLEPAVIHIFSLIARNTVPTQSNGDTFNLWLWKYWFLSIKLGGVQLFWSISDVTYWRESIQLEVISLYKAFLQTLKSNSVVHDKERRGKNATSVKFRTQIFVIFLIKSLQEIYFHHIFLL